MSLHHFVLPFALIIALFYQHLFLVTAGVHNASVIDLQIKEEVTCPKPEDIAPCNCTVENELFHKVLDITCEGIQDEHQLYDIFHSHLPVTNFRTLNLDTQYLESLSANVFGDATFKVVRARALNTLQGSLASVDPETFIKSSSTLTWLDLFCNRLTGFPYETLSKFSKLLYFGINWNLITDFPVIQSHSLEEITVATNPIDHIPDGALDGMPNLRYFHIHSTSITDLPTGLFVSLHKMKLIYMADNRLANLTEGQFEVRSINNVDIFLSGNQISDIEPDTFKVLRSGTIDLEDNELTILPEATWKPVLDARVNLHLDNNPLTCGCDVAWLVLEPSYHQLVANATCSNGAGNLVDLDPTWFEENC